MKKLFNFRLLVLIGVLIMSVSQVWASTSVTFYLAVDAAKTRNNNNCCNVQAQIKYGGGGDNDNWSAWMTMTKTSHTYNGKLVYSQSFTFNNDGWHCWQFRMEENGNQHWYKSIYCGSWQTDCHDGDLYDYENSTWVDSPSWDESYKIYFSNQWNWGAVRAYAWNNECDYNAGHPGSTLESTGCKHNGHDIYRLTLNKRYSKIQFNCNSNDCKEDNQECYSNRGKQFGGGEGWYAPSFDGYTFSNGATVVWDACEESWTTAYLYNFDLDGDNDIPLKRIGSTSQFYETATSNVKTGAWILRNAQDFSHEQTTDITSDISGVTLFTYCATKTGSKLDWQVTSNAKKANGSTKVYFDNSDAKWSSIYLKYGTTWYTRATSAATKVNGTDNLYCITIPNDAYYKEYFLCDATGSTGYVDIETMTSINNRIVYQESNISSEITYIPTSGAGTPKVWTASTMSGHEHNVTITAPSHGTITVAYKNENNVSQSQTSGSFDVARTCSLTVSATADTGYKLATDGLTIDDVAHTSGNVYIIKKDITVAATFTAKQSVITFQKYSGIDGATGTTATYDADMPTVTVPHKIGYKFEGYYDSQTDGNGSGTKYYNADGTSAKKWDKNTESATTLYAKWVADNKTFKADAATTDWATDANWSPTGAPSNDYSAVTINGDVTLSSSVHIGSLTIGTGKLTIASTGVLEVAGTVSNTYSDKIEIISTGSNQGALICDLSSAPAATVNMTFPSSGWHLIASPTGGARVSSSLFGTGVYTYAWKEGEGWDNRGYYEDFVGEAILIYGRAGCNFSGYLANHNGGGLAYTSTPKGKDAQGVNIFPNTLTAPISIEDIDLDDSADGHVYLLENGVWVDHSSGVIPALNGYLVVSKSTGGTVEFEYDVAVRGASSKNAGLKAPQRTTAEDQDYMTLTVTTNERKIDLRLYEDAAKFTDEIDRGYEAFYIQGDGRFGQLYAHAERKMTKLAKANLEGTVLGFAPGEAESFTISFEGDGKGYYLNDVVTCKSTLIDENNIYEFTSDENTNDTRFVISKTPISKTPTSVDNIIDGVKARKQLIDGTLYIIRDGRIYTATGNVVK